MGLNMDLATIIGITLGTGLLLGAIALDGQVLSFWELKSFLIVVGGTIAATLVNFPLKELTGIVSIFKNSLVSKENDSTAMIHSLVDFAESSRREGLLALEEKAQSVDEDFLKKGVQLVVDGTDAELVRNIMEIELAFLEERHKSGQRIFEQMGAYAPAFGMIGTLIGLIQMLQVLDDPSLIGAGMAVALLTTLYGAVIANLFFLPLAAKLRLRSSEEIRYKEIIIEGVLSIQAGENPRIVEEKLKAFLPPDQRKQESADAPDEGVAANA